MGLLNLRSVQRRDRRATGSWESGNSLVVTLNLGVRGIFEKDHVALVNPRACRRRPDWASLVGAPFMELLRRKERQLGSEHPAKRIRGGTSEQEGNWTRTGVIFLRRALKKRGDDRTQPRRQKRLPKKERLRQCGSSSYFRPYAS